MEVVVVEKVRGLNLAFSTELWQPLPQKYSPQKYSPTKYTPQKYSLQKTAPKTHLCVVSGGLPGPTRAG